jgi:hypothetical protein
MQRNLLQRGGQLIGLLAAAQHWFSKADIENAQVRSVRNRPFAAWVSDVSVADKPDLCERLFLCLSDLLKLNFPGRLRATGEEPFETLRRQPLTDTQGVKKGSFKSSKLSI